jgi:poly(3-hydroxyalkanoate) synthetase
MNPWDLWIWPWIAASEIARHSLDLAGATKESTSGGGADDRPGAPEWASSNRVALELAALRLRDFSEADSSQRPALIVAPFALHDAAIADLATGHSLVETLRANGCSRLFLVEWKSATAETKLDTIDTQLAALNVAIDEIGAAVDLIGLCQGGWLSLIYATRFPTKVRRLVLAGAPVDLAAGPSAVTTQAKIIPKAVISDMIGRGDGLVLGRNMLDLWPQASDDASLASDALQLETPPLSESERQACHSFLRWYRRTLDLPGPYYCQVYDWLFRENRLAVGAFVALGQTVDLKRLRSPLFLLAGDKDVVAPPAQVFAAATLVGAEMTGIEMALAPCGHHALFMGQRTLTHEWPKIAHWLSRTPIDARKSIGKKHVRRKFKAKRLAVQ